MENTNEQNVNVEEETIENSKLSYYVGNLGLDEEIANKIIEKEDINSFYEQIITYDIDSKYSANLLVNECIPVLESRKIDIKNSNLTTEGFVELVGTIKNEEISYSNAKRVLKVMIDVGGSPNYIIENLGLATISDKDELNEFVNQVITNNEEQVAEYKNGSKEAKDFLLKEVSKASNGRANMIEVEKLLEENLGSGKVNKQKKTKKGSKKASKKKLDIKLKLGIWAVVLILLAIAGKLAFDYAYSIFVPEIGVPIYNQRLDGIPEIDESLLAQTQEYLNGKEQIVLSEVRVQGSIIYITAEVTKETTIEDSEAILKDGLVYLDDNSGYSKFGNNQYSELLDIYDVQFMVTNPNEEPTEFIDGVPVVDSTEETEEEIETTEASNETNSEDGTEEVEPVIEMKTFFPHFGSKFKGITFISWQNLYRYDQTDQSEETEEIIVEEENAE